MSCDRSSRSPDIGRAFFADSAAGFKAASSRRGNLVLRAGLEIAGVVAFVQLTGGLAPSAVDHASALHRRAFGDGVGPALHVFVLLHAQEFAGAVEHALRQAAVP